jgi:hypothetical protein
VKITREEFVGRLNIDALQKNMETTREWAVKTRYQSLRLHAEKAPEEQQVQQANLAAKAELEAWTAYLAFQAELEGYDAIAKQSREATADIDAR